VIAFFSLAVIFTVPTPPAVDLDRLAVALEEREAGSWHRPGGRANWQRTTWQRFTTLDFRLAQDPYWSRKVARWALEAYAAEFRAAGVEPTVWRLATAWRRGDTGALRATRRPNDYGTLAEGIYGAIHP